MKYYVRDSTIGQIVEKNSVLELVAYLEEVCKRHFKQSRAVYMDEMISLGHGYDDNDGMYFTERMSTTFDIGVVQGSDVYHRTNIHEYARNKFFKTETGD